MKLFTKFFIGMFLALPILSAGEIKIEWFEPEEYRDADYYYNGSEKSKKMVLTNLEKYFVKQAKTKITEGHVLEMKVTELDLAGDFEPWHGPSMDDIRIIKEIYPARIEFDYKLLDADGAVVKEGTEVLRDLMVPNSITTMSIGRSEQYPYIKDLVRSWMKKITRE